MNNFYQYLESFSPAVLSIIAAFIISLVSFVGVFSLPFYKFKKAIPLLVSLAAGAMIGDVFLHIIPHILEENKDSFDPKNFMWLIAGIAAFYLLETVFSWHHQHSVSDSQKPHTIGKMVLVGDSLHNFFDGLGIAVAFAVSPAIGVATTIAFMIHEIPQEIGDFAIFINSGWSRKKALIANFLSGLTAVVGAIVGGFLLNSFETIELPILMFTAGSLIYISLADLIPESNNHNMKHHKSFRFVTFLSFIIGVAVMYGITFIETH
jgi:zinc and cadmium transporter